MNPDAFLRLLLDEAAAPFRAAGQFAYHYARGKLGSDCIFRELLRRGIFLPPEGTKASAAGHHLDLGCGQGSLFAWLLAARRCHERGQWPDDWPAPPRFSSLRGIELMHKDVARAKRAFRQLTDPAHPLICIEQGDMQQADFGQADVITILDALHYFDPAGQEMVLRRIHAALPAGGLFLTRIGDAGAGLPYHLCNLVDRLVTFVRGHRLSRLYCRPLPEWMALLERIGFTVNAIPMNAGKPFANVMLVCRVPGAVSPGRSPAV